MSGGFLRVEDLQKRHGGAVVLDHVGFVLEKGRCLALLGPSGCGKSTLLNILAGLLPSDGGRILLDGTVIEDAAAGVALPAQRRRFAMVFQDLSLWPHLTVARNVAFGLDYLPLGREEKRGRVEEVLRLVGMEGFRDRLPATLSGGQQQRVAIARAIVVRPAVLLMDEPLAALDTKLREELRDEIAAIIRRTGMTTVYVTHDHAEAMTVAHHVAVMHRGRLEQVAAPREIYLSPATTAVAEFLGSTNHLPLTDELRNARDAHGAALFPVLPPGARFLVVAREAMRIAPERDAACEIRPGCVRWTGRVVKNSFAGARNEIHAALPSGGIVRGFTPAPLPIDEPVVVEFDADGAAFVER